MGIGGSGLAGVAQIAKFQGYNVSGCEINPEAPYLDMVKKAGITFYIGHDSSHIKNSDLVAVSPHVFYLNLNHPETALARKKGILMKWQDFMGKYLHKDKFLICVAGTHGKSTTTALVGLLLEKAGLDPTVEVGATVKDWHNNIKIGKSKYFISEADEFHDNFATYYSDIIVLTLVEYDHPEFFGSIENMLACYQRFIDRLKPGGKVIYNADSPMVNRLKLPANSLPYHLSEFPADLKLSQPGNHNKLNALAILKLGNHLKISNKTIYQVLKNFKGLDRRLEFIGESHGIKVYDDYANHPSSYAATISAVKELYPTSKLWVVIEPHTFSRLRVMLDELPESLKGADHVIVSKIFASREQDPGDFTSQDIVNALHHPDAHYIPEFSDIVSHLTHNLQPKTNNIILVMGSGNSYKLSRQLFESL